MSPGAPVIEVRGLTKSYGDVHAVRGIDLHVDQGEILAFLGSNGAGKTTAIEILEGFRTRTSGEVRVMGHDPANAPLSWREDLGIVLQESEPNGDLTARESLELYASYYAAPRPVDEVLELVGLREHGGQRTDKLSGGQQRRLDLATALIGDPKLIFLDEPTTGFDPSARRDAWGMIENLRTVGATVLLTTHYMDEAEHLSDRIVVISEGLIVAKGTADDLADQVKLLTVIRWDLAEVPVDAMPDQLRALVTVSENHGRLETKNVAEATHFLTSWAVENGSMLESLSVHRPNLEDTFLRLTDGGAARATSHPDEAAS